MRSGRRFGTPALERLQEHVPPAVVDLLVIAEEEGFIFLDRSAEGEAIHIVCAPCSCLREDVSSRQPA